MEIPRRARARAPPLTGADLSDPMDDPDVRTVVYKCNFCALKFELVCRVSFATEFVSGDGPAGGRGLVSDGEGKRRRSIGRQHVNFILIIVIIGVTASETSRGHALVR